MRFSLPRTAEIRSDAAELTTLPESEKCSPHKLKFPTAAPIDHKAFVKEENLQTSYIHALAPRLFLAPIE